MPKLTAPLLALAALATCTPQERYVVASSAIAAGGSAAAAFCAAESGWAADWESREEQVLAYVNMVRADGGSCGERGEFPPAPPLRIHPALRCAARVHAQDLSDRGAVSHESADGAGPFERILRAGYPYSVAGENVAGGPATPFDVVQAWLDSDSHCAIVLDARFGEVGIGFAQRSEAGAPWSTYWTLCAASR